MNKKKLDDINNIMLNDYDNFINKIADAVSRDKDIIILQQVIKNQYEKIKKAEKHIIEYKQKYEEASGTIELIKGNINYLYISKDKIKEKIEEIEKRLSVEYVLYEKAEEKSDTQHAIHRRINMLNFVEYELKELLGE